MPKRPEELEPIIDRVVGQVVDSALERSGGDYGFRDVKRWIQIERAWLPTLEGFITDRVKPVGYRRGTLYVTCRSAAMEQELVYIKDLVLSKLRDVLPEIPLEDIRASLHSNHRSTTAEKTESPKPWLHAPNTDEEIAYANESTKNLSGDLAEEMKRVILLGLRAERIAGEE
jgi:hypothetical protein